MARSTGRPQRRRNINRQQLRRRKFLQHRQREQRVTLQSQLTHTES